MDLSGIPIVDHHAHPLLRPEATGDASGFRRWFTESSDPEIHAGHVVHSLFYRTSLQFLAERLECEADLKTILAARAAQPEEIWVRDLFSEANISLLLCDYGYGGKEAYDHSEMLALLPCPVWPILRLESLAEECIVRNETFAAMQDNFVAEVSRARANGFVALKTIIAYRSGLAIGPSDVDGARADFTRLKKEMGRSDRLRLAQKSLVEFLLWQALDQAVTQDLPVQFHTGFGDNDADLLSANPLHLRHVIERSGAQIVILHTGWPFFRESAHLSAIYGNVWLDLSLAIPFATSGIPAMLRDMLGMAPFSKIMFATDAFTMAEIYWLAARWGRWGLGKVLEEFVSERFLSADQAWSAAERILGGNARQLYGL